MCSTWLEANTLLLKEGIGALRQNFQGCILSIVVQYMWEKLHPAAWQVMLTPLPGITFLDNPNLGIATKWWKMSNQNCSKAKIVLTHFETDTLRISNATPRTHLKSDWCAQFLCFYLRQPSKETYNSPNCKMSGMVVISFMKIWNMSRWGESAQVQTCCCPAGGAVQPP